MGLYNLSEFMTLIKSNIGVRDVPLPCDDSELVKRFANSALKQFSVRYPHIDYAYIGDNECIDQSHRGFDGSAVYIIPEKYYQGTEILDVIRLMSNRTGSESDLYMPTYLMGSADGIISAIADIKLAASLASQFQRSPTHEFKRPNRLTIFNGWLGQTFGVELALKHDLSLSTVPNTAFPDLIKLTELDMKVFLKRLLQHLTEL